ncbi:hypothetical protein B0H13DRAFT_2481333, partial [Mycena leptocephala]
VDFHGTYPVLVDPLVSPRARVEMVAREIWNLSGFRFTRKLKTGHRTRYWCSQDGARKKRSKASQDPNIRNRDTNNEGELNVTVRLKHAAKHVSYVDVAMPPEALAMIRDNVEWLTPGAMVTKVQAAFPSVTAQQIHRAWMEMSEPFWRFDNDQLLSTKKVLEDHLDDVDIFEPEDVPDGVEMLCWGMKKIAMPLTGKIHDGAGFPLTYLLLSTSTSIDQGKRTKALTAWARCVRAKYGVEPRFTHVDKDMAKIGMLKDVWNAKISLCWWHLRRAVRTRLANAKLSTTPYDPGRAHAEFPFIDVTFVPMAQADGGEYEGGQPETVTPVVPASQPPRTFTAASGLRVTIPARPALATVGSNGQTIEGAIKPRVAEGRGVEGESTVRAHVTEMCLDRRAAQPQMRIPTQHTSDSEDEDEGEEKQTRRTFCPAGYRVPIVSMLEKHYCAHPLLPGYAHPSAEGIRRWAVLQMYKFCFEHGLREVWAYLWENWYRSSRWELWARSVHAEIPVLKTTMILESHWRRIKHDFLHHFHMPRCDLLAWILIVKLAPSFHRKLDRLLTDTGRYRELPSWREHFKRTWRELEKRPITLPVNPAYKTDTKKMICVKPVPPVFFLEVKRQRTAPFWTHPSLRPLGDDSGPDEPSEDIEMTREDAAANASVDSEEDDDDGLVDTQPDGDQRTFVEAMDEEIDVILEFAKGLRFQRQFRDQRMLQALQREGASFLRLARACLGKEKRLRSTRGAAPSTWDRSAGSAMFYRARPASA